MVKRKKVSGGNLIDLRKSNKKEILKLLCANGSLCCSDIARKINLSVGGTANITDEMLSEAEDASVVMPEFLDFIGDSVLVAHNASFDVGFLRQWCFENNIKISPTVLDTVELVMNLEDEFEIELEMDESFKTVGDVVKAIEEKLA